MELFPSALVALILASCLASAEDRTFACDPSSTTDLYLADIPLGDSYEVTSHSSYGQEDYGDGQKGSCRIRIKRASMNCDVALFTCSSMKVAGDPKKGCRGQRGDVLTLGSKRFCGKKKSDRPQELELTRTWTTLEFRTNGDGVADEGFACQVWCKPPEPPEGSCKCGRVKPSSRVFRGKDVTPNQYPWHVRVEFDTIYGTYTDGALINSKWVLTTRATFIDPEEDMAVRVVLGDHNLEAYEDSYDQVIAARGQVVSDPPDLMLVELEREVDLATAFPFIEPICLPTAPVEDREQGVVTGWITQRILNPSEETLRKASVTLATRETCQAAGRKWETVDEGEFCAGTRGGVRGDRGGCGLGEPLAALRGGSYELAGLAVVPYCGNKGYLPLYKDVYRHLDWIMSTATGGTTCPP